MQRKTFLVTLLSGILGLALLPKLIFGRSSAADKLPFKTQKDPRAHARKTIV